MTEWHELNLKGQILFGTFAIIYTIGMTFMFYKCLDATQNDQKSFCDKPFNNITRNIFSYNVTIFKLPEEMIKQMCDDKLSFVNFQNNSWMIEVHPEYFLRNLLWIPFMAFNFDK